MISNFSVLNIVKDNSADVFVDANGFLNITGCPAVKAKTAKVNTIAIVQPTAGIYTVAFTAQASYTYAFRVTGYDSNNNRITVPFYYTSPASGATATTIADAVRAMITSSIIGAQFASIGGTATVVLTGTLANPLVSFENFNRDPNIVISAVGSGTTLGIEAQGYGADLLVAYGGFAGGSSIVPTNYYTQHEISLTPDIMFGGQSVTEVGSTTYIVLVNASAVTGGTDNVAVNIDLINNTTYGTVALLKAGYRAVAPTTAATTTAAITVTTGAIALAGGAVTFASLGAESGDYLVINSGTTFSTFVGTKITGISGAAAGFGTNIVAQAAAAFKYIAARHIPN
jgi:hypothetical protein